MEKNAYLNWCVCELLSHVQLFPTLWTVACQAPRSMEFSPKQEYWTGLPFPSPGDLCKPGIKPTSPALQADSLPLSHLGSPSVTIPPTYYGLADIARKCIFTNSYNGVFP